MDNISVWVDISVTDLDRAIMFYGAVLQHEVDAAVMGSVPRPGITHELSRGDARGAAGLEQRAVGAAGIAQASIGNVNPWMVCALLLGSIPGIVAGSHLTLRTPNRLLRICLAAVLLLSGIALLGKA